MNYNTIRDLLKKYLIATVLKLTGFRAWIAGVIFNKVWPVVQQQVFKIVESIKDKKTESEVKEELKKPNVDLDKRGELEKDILEGR